MKLSELILIGSKTLDEHGDIEVTICSRSTVQKPFGLTVKSATFLLSVPIHDGHFPALRDDAPNSPQFMLFP
jgi:hypothetical protein